jgi:hypothetical protein
VQETSGAPKDTNCHHTCPNAPKNDKLGVVRVGVKNGKVGRIGKYIKT